MVYSALIFILAASVLADESSTQVSSFFVKNASIDVQSCMSTSREELAFACHKLEPGSGFALLTRAYVSSNQVDTDAYFKTTFFFPHGLAIGRKIKLPSSDVFVFQSFGSSSFPDRTGCYGQAESGEVEVIKVPSQTLRVIYNLSFRMRSVNGHSGECSDPDVVSRSFDARKVSFKDLNAWLGLKGIPSDAWNESHPEPHP